MWLHLKKYDKSAHSSSILFIDVGEWNHILISTMTEASERQPAHWGLNTHNENYKISGKNRFAMKKIYLADYNNFLGLDVS